MKWFGRQSAPADPGVPPELQPYFASPHRTARRWLWAAAVGVVVLLLVWLGLYLAHRNSHIVRNPAAQPHGTRVQQSPQTNHSPAAPQAVPTPPASNQVNTQPVAPPSATLPNTGG